MNSWVLLGVFLQAMIRPGRAQRHKVALRVIYAGDHIGQALLVFFFLKKTSISSSFETIFAVVLKFRHFVVFVLNMAIKDSGMKRTGRLNLKIFSFVV